MAKIKTEGKGCCADREDKVDFPEHDGIRELAETMVRNGDR